MKKHVAVSLGLAVSLMISACAGSDGSTDNEPPPGYDAVAPVVAQDEAEYQIDLPEPTINADPYVLTSVTQAMLFSVANPTAVVGNGTAKSCTENALADAIRGGGVVVFDCGSNPVTISIKDTLYVCNTHTCEHPWKGGVPVERLVVDGGGKVTLAGGGERGIFYANTCEESLGWLSSSCQYETTPHVVFQNITFRDGDASKGPRKFDSVGGGGGGGAIAMRGGQLTVINVTFDSNRCMTKHSDAGGGAIRVTSMLTPARIQGSTFLNNSCANGGAISALHASLHIADSTFAKNTATGKGASSGEGGNGGAIYYDGNSNSVVIERTIITNNVAPEGGSAVFYVSNDRSGHLIITDSILTDNTGESFYTAPYRSIFYLGNGPIQESGSEIE